MDTWLGSLAQSYGDVCELVEVGASYEGRSIKGLRVTGRGRSAAGKSGFWLDGGL